MPIGNFEIGKLSWLYKDILLNWIDTEREYPDQLN
jgi:hypothetical protein